MLYLIGGPPKCGKTTLAKKLSRKLGTPWVASDTLQVIGMKYTQKYATKKMFDELYPHTAMRGKTNDETYSRYTPREIAKNYIKQAKATYDAIDMFCICEITDGNDYIIEGYHVTPELVSRLMKKYGGEKFRAVFLTKKDTEAFMRDVVKSSTPGDWILKKTKKKETFGKIAEMVRVYSGWFEKEALRREFKIFSMDHDFNKRVSEVTVYLENAR